MAGFKPCIESSLMEWRRISCCDTRASSSKSQLSFQASAFALAPSGSCTAAALTLAQPTSADCFSAPASAADSLPESSSLVCSACVPIPATAPAPELPLPAPAPAAQPSAMSLEDLYFYKPQKASAQSASSTSSSDPWKELKPITNRFEV